MKKVISLFIFVTVFLPTYSATTSEVKPALKASELYLTVGKTGKSISLMELSQISFKDFENVTGRKMKFFERLSFTLAQKKVRNIINRDGTISISKMRKYVEHHDDQTGACIGGFFLGLVLGPLGLLLAYSSTDDKKHNRIIWAWIGMAIWTAFLILVYFSGGLI